MICKHCGGFLKGNGGPGIIGTRADFGVMKSFIDEENGQEINNWSTWEKRGFKTIDATRNNKVKAGAKEKMDKIKHKNKQQ